MKRILSILVLGIGAILEGLGLMAWPVKQATSQNPLIGATRGKLGGVVFQRSMGLNILRTKPDQVRNPRTAGQIQQRTRLTTLNSYFRIILSTIRLGFGKYAYPKPAWSKFIGENLKNAFTDSTLNWADVIISKGSLVGFLYLEVSNASQASFMLGWSNNAGYGNALATDVCHACLYNEDNETWYTFPEETRSNMGTELTSSCGSSGDTVHVFCFYVSADGSLVSDTEYMTSTLVA